MYIFFLNEKSYLVEWHNSIAILIYFIKLLLEGLTLKKLFFVLNKEKIYAYAVSILTIVTIFFVSSLINTDLKNTEFTSSNIVENTDIGEAISTSIPYETNSVQEANVVENVMDDAIDRNTIE